jgi:hypothetical protein
MRNLSRILPAIIVIAVLASGCAIFRRAPDVGPTPVPVPSPTPLNAAETTFTVMPPEGTPSNAGIALVLLDEVTGLTYNTRTVPMKRQSDGHWQVNLTPPAGSLLRYRYTRQKPSAADEITALGTAINYRIAHITGPMQIDDIIAAWADAPFQGSTGRIIGHVSDSTTQQPLSEMIVSVAGINTFTDGEGSFRIDGLPIGQHMLTVFSPDGQYKTAQQGAVVAQGSTTPAKLLLEAAHKVQITFEINVPSDTIPGTPLRMAGNVRQLGNSFGVLAGGFSVSPEQMPTAALVTPTDYIAVVTLYSGTDLRYKYTLGDGLWNAERDEDGYFLTRQVIVPEKDVVMKDTVATWHGGKQGSINFFVTVPESTPPKDLINLQLNPFNWLAPLPMWRLSQTEWFYILHGPLDFSEALTYRYCRNFQCGSADDGITPGDDAAGRTLNSTSEPQDVVDVVETWSWWDLDVPATTVVAPEITPRMDFEAGISLLPAYRPDWQERIGEAITEIAELGGNAVILRPSWSLALVSTIPLISFDPATAPYQDDLNELAAQATHEGLQISIYPSVQAPSGKLTQWWSSATRDSSWWAVWFEEYRSFMLTYARYAEEIGANKLIFGGMEIAPSLPGGLLQDGTPSGLPQDAEGIWRELIAESRTLFSGKLVFEIELGAESQLAPPFIDDFDEVQIYWHAPLAEDDEASMADLQQSASVLLDEFLLSNPRVNNMPLVLSVEYLSAASSVTACAKAPDGSCRSNRAFDQGAVIDPDLEIDLLGQARAINAVILVASTRSEVDGFYVRSYNPTVALLDKSASIHGKPARDVLWYWYPRITGKQ